jgi:hypothetical protein
MEPNPPSCLSDYHAACCSCEITGTVTLPAPRPGRAN